MRKGVPKPTSSHGTKKEQLRPSEGGCVVQADRAPLPLNLILVTIEHTRAGIKRHCVRARVHTRMVPLQDSAAIAPPPAQGHDTAMSGLEPGTGSGHR